MSALPPYASPLQRTWHYTFRLICGLIFFFLIFPIMVILPLSFNAENFFTFTKAMLALDPAGYSFKHYYDFFTNPDWQQALTNSVMIAPRRDVAGNIVRHPGGHRPVAVPCSLQAGHHGCADLTDDRAADHFGRRHVFLLFAHRSAGHLLGVVLAHAALGTPFVIITVTATLVGFDRSLVRASASLGANSVTTFFKVQMPLIIPGVVSGALFAFITSFDEVVVVLFLGSASQKTLPWQMFTGLREQISPTILAVASLMVAISIVLLTVLEMLRRRSERLRGLSPG
ncbi:ABC transporter permease [Roseibium salinum]|nr:ABC transporter permease [Roseibium salinum]